MFTAGGDGLACAIFDPLPRPMTPLPNRRSSGACVSVDRIPVPRPIVGGPMDTANAFLSWSHEAASDNDNVTDATYSGDTPPLPWPPAPPSPGAPVTCTALAADEVRCVDATSGHGMRVSVRDYDLF